MHAGVPCTRTNYACYSKMPQASAHACGASPIAPPCLYGWLHPRLPSHTWQRARTHTEPVGPTHSQSDFDIESTATRSCQPRSMSGPDALKVKVSDFTWLRVKSVQLTIVISNLTFLKMESGSTSPGSASTKAPRCLLA